jgi:hypothetical protein
MKHKLSLMVICLTITALLTLLWVPAVSAADNCSFTTHGKTKTLNGNCTTDATILIPNGMTLNGAGYTITGIDPPGGHFVGAVVGNGGTNASVINLTVTVFGLANVCDAGADRLRGIMFEGAGGTIENNTVVDINQGASGCQEGNAIEVRNFGAVAWTPNVRIRGNVVSNYQKTGIVANGDVQAQIDDNIVTGAGPVNYIAQNGIQIGFGAKAIVRGNQVSDNSYTGTSTASGGILVVGGPGYGGDYTVGTQIVGNTVVNNDVGVYVSNVNAAPDYAAPDSATNIKVINNTISSSALQNNYGGFGYQAGVADQGNNDKIINNNISGAGYNPSANPGAYTVAIDADESFTNRPKVHANDISG